jgi:integrase/recombinase XerD
MGILRDRMIEEMKLRNFSPATQVSYVYAVSRLARYHHKSPDQLSKEDIRVFLLHLTVERKLSPNSLTGYCCGLRFFYNETLGWDENKLFIPPRKKPSVLPEVFSPDEVVRLIGAARGLKQRVLLMTGLFGRTQSQGVSQSHPASRTQRANPDQQKDSVKLSL